MATSPSTANVTTNALAKGTVVFVQGEAYLRDNSGKLSAIKPGDVVTEGQEIVTRNGAVVELRLPGGAKVSIGPDRELLLNDEFFATASPERSENAVSSLGADADRVIQALNAGKDPFEDLEDPAAGLTGGGLGDQTHDFVRLVRILEDVTPVSYDYATTGEGVEFLPAAALTTQTINTPPLATDDNITGTEDQPLVVDVLANDSDANNDALSVTGATAVNGQVTINPDGSLRYVPNPNFNGTDTVTYTISDGRGGSSTATVTINVTAVNDGPVALPDVATTPEDTPITVAVLGNDSDPDGDPLTVTGAIVDPTRGTVVVNPDGTLSFTPAPDITGTVVITYTVSDGKGGTATSTLTVTVTPVNDQPIANPDTATTPENTPVTVSVLGNDSDPEGDPLTVTGATVDPTLGSVVVNPDGTLTFTPANNTNGPVVITYSISDGQGGSATSTVTIDVTPVNEAPVANPSTATTPEETPVTLNVLGNDSDPDGDPLTVTSATVDPAKGSVSINPDGTLAFNPAPNFNGPVEITYTISDGKGGSATSTVTVNVTPANDAPLAVNDSATTTEDSPVSRTPATGVLTNDSDIDSPSLTVSGVRTGTSGAFTAPGAAGVTLTGTYGALLIRADGSYTYTPGTAAQALNTGDSVQDVFSYQLSDGSLTATANLSITVTGANDAAVITGLATGSVKEDTAGQLTATGTLAATDVDSPATFTPASASGTYGSFNIAANGTWTYVLNNTAGNVQALNEGDSRTETFTVTTADGTPRNVTVTVLGTNETPTVANVTASGAEDPATPIPVTLTGADVDGTVTSLTLADLPANGTLYRDAAMTQPVTAGTPLAATAGAVTLYFQPAPNWNGSTSFHFTATDNNGGSSPQATATVNVTPVNDAATISTGTGSTQEDTVLLATGTLTITDPDAGEAAFQVQTGVPGTYGSFSISESGNWTFTLDNGNPIVQSLANGDSRTESFTVRSVDGTESTVVVTILGTNETIGAPGTGVVKEDNPISANGTLTASGGATFVPQPATPGTYGSFTLNPDGTWTYLLDNPASVVQSLGEGQTRTEVFPVTLSDGSTSTVTITVVGTNDPALIGPGTGDVTEDTQLSTGGTLSITDVDSGEAGFQPQTSVAGTYGIFNLDAGGNWTYTLNNAHPSVQALGVGETLSETFPVFSTDGTASSVLVTINGTNDGPVANPSTATTPEETPVTLNVLGNDSDPDGDTLTVTSATVDPAKGSVSINPDGTLAFNPAPNFNGPVEITYTISDGKGGTATSTVTVNVTPLPDAAQLGTGSGTVKEDTPAQSTASGTLSIVDPDAGEAVFQARTNVPGTYGSFSINPAGDWTYTIDNTLPVVQALKEGETRNESFTVLSADGTATTVSLTIVGTNDGPVANPSTATTPEETPVTLNVLGNDSDPDGDTLTVTSATVDPAKGSVTINPDGSLAFNPAPNFNGPVEITYAISDGKGGSATSTVTVNVTPLPDAATISTGTGSTQEDTVLLAAGTLTITDPDAGEAAFQVQTGVPGTYGSFSISESGNWTFTLDNGNPIVQSLANGDSRTESFTVRSVDGTESTVVVTILGTNETIGAPGTGVVKEDNPISANGTLTASGGATFVPQPATPGTYGSFTLNPDGTWTYLLDNPASVVQSLGEGQTRTEVFPVTLSDGSTSTVTITVVGTNDPALIGPGTGDVTEDTQLSTGGTLSITDVDSGEAGFQPQTSVAGTYGIFNLDAGGNWTYTLNNAHPSVQALGVGETLSETFPVFSTDGTASSVLVTINGTNDGPVANPSTATTPEETPVTLNVLGNDSDPDGDTLTVTSATVDPAKGSVSINPDGTLAFNPAPNFNGPVEITYAISDGKGGTATSTVTVNVTPVPTRPS
jgi:VCBS repeat-containing protein